MRLLLLCTAVSFGSGPPVKQEAFKCGISESALRMSTLKKKRGLTIPRIPGLLHDPRNLIFQPMLVHVMPDIEGPIAPMHMSKVHVYRLAG